MTALPLERLLGLSREEAELLARRAHERLGTKPYLVRAAAFLVAASPATRWLLPPPYRVRAIRPYLHALLPGPTENLLYAEADERAGEGD